MCVIIGNEVIKNVNEMEGEMNLIAKLVNEVNAKKNKLTRLVKIYLIGKNRNEVNLQKYKGLYETG